MKKTLGLLVAACMTTGCAVLPADGNRYKNGNSPYLITAKRDTVAACDPLSREQELAINLSKEMVSARRLHAALANLERLPDELPEARLGKAQILRLLQRPEAKGLYQSLLNSCLIADGYHGLAQMAVLENDNDTALSYMQKAVAYEPTNESMRNDLGVIYMNLRKTEEARFELLTAAELNESNPRAILNLLTLTLYQENITGADKLAARYQISAQQYQSALNKARTMRKQDSGGTAQAVAQRPAAQTAVRAVPAQPAVAQAPAVRAVQPQPVSQVRAVSPQGVQQAAAAGGVTQGVQRIDAVSQPIVPISLR
ncbi:tetratricopeptide repeat protein [Oceanimonas smirnovii]|uniref:tetratricopeptide repeat protein n=1 Tax=Oceanimonas smirnovii TaxID=264574 RepID=UPI000382E2EC|nr:tetratricopeptide repeat protein [Oceanimonas smirnovii]